MYWTSVITNNATNELYLSGYTWTMTPFTGLIDLRSNISNIAAKFSLSKMSYIWIKAYLPDISTSNSIAIN